MKGGCFNCVIEFVSLVFCLLQWFLGKQMNTNRSTFSAQNQSLVIWFGGQYPFLLHFVAACLTFTLYRYNNRQLAADADVTDTTVENLQQCMALFLDQPNCQLFSYYQQNNTCKLYDLSSASSSGYTVADGFVFQRFCTSGMFSSCL